MPWFESWFDSPYYHILYQNRDEHEAEIFLDNLLKYLQPKAGDSMLDLGCGKGRHAVYLNGKGFQVTGIDLSEQSIRYCLQFENETLSFFIHDMRRLFRVNDFDFVFNLFTSFGYFETEKENLAAIKNACLSLKKGGTIVIDYLNSEFVKNNLVSSNTIEVENIVFHIKKELTNGFFIKDIQFSDKGENFHFTEKVSALSIADFEKYLKLCGMQLNQIFGDYNLDKFDLTQSPRLIIIAVKE